MLRKSTSSISLHTWLIMKQGSFTQNWRGESLFPRFRSLAQDLKEWRRKYNLGCRCACLHSIFSSCLIWRFLIWVVLVRFLDWFWAATLTKPAEVIRHFIQCLLANGEVLPKIRSGPLHSTSSSMHYSLRSSCHSTLCGLAYWKRQ
jgi:hypothetical protein